MTSLADAIVAARQANPGAYANVSSNYLLGLLQQGKISGSQVASVSNTVFGSSNTLSAIAKFINGSSPSGAPTGDSGGQSFPSSSTPPNSIQSPGSIGDAFKNGLSSAGNFFKQNPTFLIVAGVIGLAVVLKK